ncbi:Unknown protein [Striga hermonthica]|uniref:Pectinesterase catalytic domain-containing protein n=1 Tax=Striga hermonthica TaxID=68872 RepID=A0A9N7N4F6_STRHE|nr:Unknown protein [Striga hermonthica]
MTIVNTNRYGFAVENLGDQSVFYRCNLEGYNTTLYMHGKSQFYRNCTFRGHSSLVFGFANSFFQKCEFFSMKAYPQEMVVFFSQSSPLNDFSQFIFHLCSFHVVKESPNSSATAFLGGYFGTLPSTVAVLLSSLDEYIDGYYFQEPATFFGASACYDLLQFRLRIFFWAATPSRRLPPIPSSPMT